MTVRLPRVLVSVLAGLGLAACTGTAAKPPTTTAPLNGNVISTTKLPAVDLSATPAGWVPVTFGDAQVSVPATWDVLFNVCVIGSSVGDVYLNPSGGFCTAQGPPKEKTNVTLLPVTDGEFQGSPSSYGQRSVINGIAVYDLYSYGPAPYVGTHYLVPSLGVEVAAEGPLARRVVDTLTRSPRAVALTSGPAPSVPSSWHQVSFAGLRFSVPANWPITRTQVTSGLGAICRQQGVAFASTTVTLSTDARPFLVPSCAPVSPTPQQSENGVQVDSGLRTEPTLTLPFSAHCLDLHGLTACPATSPAYSILVLRVRVPGRPKPVFVSIGLAGNGIVARTILYSLRTASPSRTTAESTGVVTGLNASWPLARRWTREMGGPMVISDGLVLFLCGRGCVAADYVSTGGRRWTFVDHKDSGIWGIVAAGGVVLAAMVHEVPNSCERCNQFSSVYRIDALDETTGRLLWSLPTSPSGNSEPVQWFPAVIAGHVAVVQLANSVALGVGLRSGRVLWRFGRPSSGCEPQPPAGAIPDVVLVPCAGRVEALDPASGRVVWKAPPASTLGPVTSAVTVTTGQSPGAVVIELGYDRAPAGVPSFKSAFETENASFDMSAMLVVNGSTGRALWALTDLAGDLVVFGGDGSLCVQAFAGVECRQGLSGRLRWSLATPSVRPGTPLQLWNPIQASSSVTYVVRPGPAEPSLVTGHFWFLESLSIVSGAKIGADTKLPEVPPDPYGIAQPPQVAAIGDGVVLVTVGEGGQQRTIAYGLDRTAGA
jgi:outer membrane protein assembly factor BamB